MTGRGDSFASRLGRIPPAADCCHDVSGLAVDLFPVKVHDLVPGLSQRLSRRSSRLARSGSSYFPAPSTSTIVRNLRHRKSTRPMNSGSLISTCSSGGGRPPLRNTIRASDSSGDSAPPSANSATSAAFRRPGHRWQAATTALSSLFDVSSGWSAEPATTTPARKSSARARSMTVLATVVTGTPSRPPTSPQATQRCARECPASLTCCPRLVAG